MNEYRPNINIKDLNPKNGWAIVRPQEQAGPPVQISDSISLDNGVLIIRPAINPVREEPVIEDAPPGDLDEIRHDNAAIFERTDFNILRPGQKTDIVQASGTSVHNGEMTIRPRKQKDLKEDRAVSIQNSADGAGIPKPYSSGESIRRDSGSSNSGTDVTRIERKADYIPAPTPYGESGESAAKRKTKTPKAPTGLSKLDKYKLREQHRVGQRLESGKIVEVTDINSIGQIKRNNMPEDIRSKLAHRQRDTE